MAMQRLGNTSQRERDLAIARKVAEMTVARLEGRKSSASAPRRIKLIKRVAAPTPPRRTAPSTVKARDESQERCLHIDNLRRMWVAAGRKWSNETGEWRPLPAWNVLAAMDGIEGRKGGQ